MTAPAPAATRAGLVRQALALEWLSLAWMLIEGVVALAAAAAARSVSLLAFGADSFIELLSAAVMLWRLTVELRRGDAFPEAVERRARRIGGALLLALALYVVAAAALELWRHRGAEVSGPALILAIAAIPIMGWLARRKLALAGALGSGALRTDAIESLTCGYLAGAVVLGITAQALLRAWWIDAVTALGILFFLVREAREALED